MNGHGVGELSWFGLLGESRGGSPFVLRVPGNLGGFKEEDAFVKIVTVVGRTGGGQTGSRVSQPRTPRRRC